MPKLVEIAYAMLVSSVSLTFFVFLVLSNSQNKWQILYHLCDTRCAVEVKELLRNFLTPPPFVNLIDLFYK